MTYRVYSGENLWRDPLTSKGSTGILLSDRISYYARTLDLIQPFKEKNLRPASYDLEVGDRYFLDDQLYSVTEAQPIEVRPNALVYIRTRQVLNLPCYLVARYSLRVSQVYRGFMLDNGLHIDPGYHGHIYVPVYNFTDDTRLLRLHEPLLSVEFAYTSTLASDDLVNIGHDNDFLGRADRTLRGVAGHPLKFFRKQPRSESDLELSPRHFWDRFETDTTHQSNLQKMENDMSEARRSLEQQFTNLRTAVESEAESQRARIDKYRNFGFVAVIAAIVSLFGLLAYHFYWTDSKVAATAQDVQRNLNTLQDGALAEIQSLRSEVDRLRTLLEGASSASSPPTPANQPAGP